MNWSRVRPKNGQIIQRARASHHSCSYHDLTDTSRCLAHACHQPCRCRRFRQCASTRHRCWKEGAWLRGCSANCFFLPAIFIKKSPPYPSFFKNPFFRPCVLRCIGVLILNLSLVCGNTACRCRYNCICCIGPGTTGGLLACADANLECCRCRH